MDREQEEMQFLGLFGIHRESCKIIVSWRKIFTQITLSLILPLSFIFLAHIEVSNILLSKIMRTANQLDETRAGTPGYNRLSDLITSEWTYFCLFKAAYFTFLLIFSLLSTSAVVYTVASIYTGRDVTFKKVMSVVPKVWKRLMVTFLCMFAAFIVYNVLAMIIFIGTFTIIILGGRLYRLGIVVFYVLLVLYFAGLVYMTIVWQLASVVSVLEEARGTKAMRKSLELIKGKKWIASAIFFILNLSFAGIQIAFQKVVVHGWSLGTPSRVFYGIVFSLLLCMFFLFGLVIQTVLYFVCKSYHHENIDKSALSDHLEVYLGEYIPLTAKDVQLEQFQV